MAVPRGFATSRPLEKNTRGLSRASQHPFVLPNSILQHGGVKSRSERLGASVWSVGLRPARSRCSTAGPTVSDSASKPFFLAEELHFETSNVPAALGESPAFSPPGQAAQWHHCADQAQSPSKPRGAACPQPERRVGASGPSIPGMRARPGREQSGRAPSPSPLRPSERLARPDGPGVLPERDTPRGSDVTRCASRCRQAPLWEPLATETGCSRSRERFGLVRSAQRELPRMPGARFAPGSFIRFARSLKTGLAPPRVLHQAR